MKQSASAGARSRSRELVLQALYQSLMTGHPFDELDRQFHERPEYARTDKAYFDRLLSAICTRRAELESLLDEFLDRPLVQLDPVEHAVLLIGSYELRYEHGIPLPAVINEAVNLAHRFGAEDGHKFVNAVLDRAAPALRAAPAD